MAAFFPRASSKSTYGIYDKWWGTNQANHKRPFHNSPSLVSYGVSLGSILEKNLCYEEVWKYIEYIGGLVWDYAEHIGENLDCKICHNLRTGEQNDSIFCKGFLITSTGYNRSTLRPEQNGHHFTDDIFKCILVIENFCILIKSLLLRIPLIIGSDNGLVQNKCQAITWTNDEGTKCSMITHQ